MAYCNRFSCKPTKKIQIADMPKIFTITGNLLAEFASEFDMPLLGGTVRAKSPTRFQVGGKGVNVSRAIAGLGFTSTLVIFPAGKIGDLCAEAIREENIGPIISSPTPGLTRTGLVAIDSSSGIETTFLNSDVPVSDSAFTFAVNKIREQSSEGDILAFCGSFPEWNPFKSKMLSELASEKGLQLCFDTYGPPLSDVFAANARILKINRKELFGLAGEFDDKSEEKFLELFNKFSAKCGAEFFAVSDGPRTTLARNRYEIGNTIKLVPPQVSKEVSATGCGDVMFAVLITNILLMGKGALDSLKSALQISSAMVKSRKIFDASLL